MCAPLRRVWIQKLTHPTLLDDNYLVGGQNQIVPCTLYSTCDHCIQNKAIYLFTQPVPFQLLSYNIHKKSLQSIGNL